MEGVGSDERHSPEAVDDDAVEDDDATEDDDVDELDGMDEEERDEDWVALSELSRRASANPAPFTLPDCMGIQEDRLIPPMSKKVAR